MAHSEPRLSADADAATPDPHGPPEPLWAAVDSALRTPRWHLRFPALLEQRFEADTAAARNRHLVLAGLVALLVYDLFLLNDLVSRPAVFGTAVAWRLGVMTPCGLLALLLVRRGLPPVWREWTMAGMLVLGMVVACMILWHTPGPAASYDLFVISLIFTAGNIVFRLRLAQALASSLLSALIALVAGMLHPGIPQEALGFAVGLLAGTAVFTVLAARQTEIGTRQSYLLLLRETLRSQAAQRTASAFAQLSQTDALTRLANRRAFDDALAGAWHQAAAQQQPLALVLVDIDHFKQFNDRHGHPAGDRCLQQVAAALAGAARDGDLVARLGGEEFGVLLADCRLSQAQAVAERLREAVERLALPHGGLPGHALVTVSLGLALAQPAAGGAALALVDRADAALYLAKRSGRNRWTQAA